MRKLILLAAVAALFMVTLPIASAAGASPFEKVDITVVTAFPAGLPPNGPFTAPGLDDCESGWAFDIGAKFSPRSFPPKGNIQVFKVFACGLDGLPGPDGPFTEDFFVVKMQVRIDQKGDNFNWVVVDGSGMLEDMKGNGHGSGEGSMTEGVIDEFSGKVRY